MRLEFNASVPGQYYRYYTGTANYVAVSSTDNHIWLLGPATGGNLLDVGKVSDFQGLAGCPSP